MQSGPAPFGGPNGASLRKVTSSDNKLHGSYYGGAFVKGCLAKGLSSANQANGKQFFVIPLNFPGAPPTFPSCPW